MFIKKLTFSCCLILLLGFTASYADSLFKPTDVSQAGKPVDGVKIAGVWSATTSDYLEDCCPDKPESFCYILKITNKSKETETYTAKSTYQQGKCPVKEVASPIGSDGLALPTCPEPLKYSFVASETLASIQIEPNTTKTLSIPKHLVKTNTGFNDTKNESIAIRSHSGLFAESIKIKNFKSSNNMKSQCFINSNGR